MRLLGSAALARTIKSLRSYPSKYPTKVRPTLPDGEWRKQRTLELYSYLPQTTLEERAKYVDIRDEVIYLNYKFFGYVASHVYLKNTSITYEDKMQSALTAFCGIWHKYMFEKKYRTDLAFSVFFKPRLSECVYRDLVTVKHTINRSLKMEAANQLGIHYSKLTYNDLSQVSMEPDKMSALKAVFNADMEEDLDTAAIFMPTRSDTSQYEEELYSDEYNDVQGLLMHEMMDREKLLTFDDLIEISDITGIDVEVLKSHQTEAENELHSKLLDIVQYKSFSDDF